MIIHYNDIFHSDAMIEYMADKYRYAKRCGSFDSNFANWLDRSIRFLIDEIRYKEPIK